MKILEWLQDNWLLLAPIVYEILVRVIPTKWNISILDNLWKLLNAIITNRRIPQPEDVINNTDSTINKVLVERDKHILK